MDFRLEKEITDLVGLVSSKFDPAYWRKVSSEQKFPEEYWEALAESGLFGMIIEKKFGGMGRSILDLTLAVEETAEHFAGLGSYLYLSGSLVSQMFEVCGSEEQKKSFLPEIAKGRLKISIALTEESSGLDASSIETTAKRISKEEFSISGRKIMVANYDRADYIILFARTSRKESSSSSSSQSKTYGISMFLISVKEQGASFKAKKLEKLGMDFVSSYSLDFEDIRVTSDHLLGKENEAWKGAARVFAMDRILTGASLVGTGKLALSTASEYAKKRRVFGRQIGSNQGIQFPLADAYAKIVGAEILVHKAASLCEAGRDFLTEASSCLLLAAEAAGIATDRALQTFGGHGYYKENDVERYWRDVRVHRVHPISEELLLATIAERALGMPRSY
jgi:acyl-CoA dehydrogenase